MVHQAVLAAILILPPVLAAQAPPSRDPAIRLAQIETAFSNRQRRASDSMNLLTREIAQLKTAVPAAATMADLRTAVKVSGERLEKLEQLNRLRFVSEVDAQALRYEAAKEIYYIILTNADKLRLTIDLAHSVAAFDNLANPMQSAQFQSVLYSLRSQQADKSTFSITPALLSNPFLSAGYVFASLFTSKLQKQEKEKTFDRIACVIDFTSRAAADTRIVRSELHALTEKLRRFEVQAATGFGGFGALVGYGRDWTGYRSERATRVADPLSAGIAGYFTRLKRDHANDAAAFGQSPVLMESRFQMERVETQLLRYEGLLADVEGFFAVWQDTLARHVSATCDAIPNLQPELRRLAGEAATLQQRFESAYFQDIPARSRGILFGS